MDEVGYRKEHRLSPGNTGRYVEKLDALVGIGRFYVRVSAGRGCEFRLCESGPCRPYKTGTGNRPCRLGTLMLCVANKNPHALYIQQESSCSLYPINLQEFQIPNLLLPMGSYRSKSTAPASGLDVVGLHYRQVVSAEPVPNEPRRPFRIGNHMV
jgi:hypothetical protein